MSQYAILFKVEVLHDYFLNRGGIVYEALNAEQQAWVMQNYAVAKFLTIVPTEKTNRVLAGHQMVCKTTATGFLIAVKLNSTTSEARPAIPLSTDFRLVFALQINDVRFFNYTALNTTSPAFYGFSNHSGNEAVGGRFLSALVPGFDPNRRYEADEVYSQNIDNRINLFRAIRDTGPTATPVIADWERIPADTFDASLSYTAGAVVLAANRLYRARVDEPGSDLNNSTDWELIATLHNQYVTSADQLTVKPATFNLDLSNRAWSEATVRLLRRGETTMIWERHYQSDNNLDTIQLDFRSLAPGTYQLEVLDSALSAIPDLGFEFYLDAAAIRNRWFGVIEIGLGSGNLALLDNNSNLRSPTYTLRFLNRSTRWRYQFPTNQVIGTIADVIPEVVGNNRILVTALPRPLTRFGTGIRLQADDATTPTVSEEVLLPEPEPNRIRRQNAQWYSEIYLSNLPLG